ncbi:hypothetical protein JCM33374_g1840 [Metschnikowia sp. JCM 33374]|nr:hypothetical protein JCM33374_g1840 [Metschnikowia sp. JCM 33374]
MQKKPHNDSSKSFTSFRFSQSTHDKKSAQKARLKEKINKVILNYLVEEGFQASAAALAQEAAVPLVNGDSGHKDDPKDLMGATSNMLLPRGLGMSPYYEGSLSAGHDKGLLRLNLIEMIRNHKSSSKPTPKIYTESPSKKPSAGDVSSTADDSDREFLYNILTFVRENLLNKVTHSMDLLRQLEVTMSLLCFDFDHQKPAHQMSELPEELRNLLNLSLRNECYRAVNSVIIDLDTSGTPESHFRGGSLNEIKLSSSQAKPVPQYYSYPDESDSSDVEINPGPDVLKSIESMITSVPELSAQVPLQANTTKGFSDAVPEEGGTNSKLEEIAKLWLATESILLLEKFIPKKRYLQDHDDEYFHL